MLVRERAAHFVPDDPVAFALNCEQYYFQMAIAIAVAALPNLESG